jgi:hypothetical protein
MLTFLTDPLLEKLAFAVSGLSQASPKIRALASQNITRPIKPFVNSVKDQGIFGVMNKQQGGNSPVLKPTMKGGMRDNVVAAPSANINKPIKPL